MSQKNSYSVLNLRKGVTEEQIKQAYIELVKQFPPETHTDRFMAINRAYETLRDPEKRAREDAFTFNYVEGQFAFTSEEMIEEAAETALPSQIRELEQKFEKDPADVETMNQLITAYMRRSYVHVKRKLWAEAIKDWQAVLGLDATHRRAKHNLNHSYINLGYYYALHDLYAEAIDLWERALQMNPDNLAIIHNLALACEMAGQDEKANRYWGEAIRRWKAALDQSPDDPYLKSLIIEVHKHHGGKALGVQRDSESALSEYREVLKINPSDFDARYQIAATYMEEKKYAEAAQELDSLRQQFPNNIDVLNLLGWALINSGQVEGAFRTWARSLQLDSKNAETRNNIIQARLTLGKRCRETGQYTVALVHFKELLKFMPNNDDVLFEIGETYRLKGDFRSAIAHYNQALAANPKNKFAKKALSEMKLRR
ncbi:MAG: tetratricopeptide repeat protein [Candidatus Sumerlaeia bacterium]|nr:tetratricopeptide repeat protein [Candidatus Sumerlaeia bacterium]